MQLVTPDDGGLGVKLWNDGVPFEPEVVQQLQSVARLLFVPFPPAGMPDAHKGRGSAVGAVIPTRAAIIPAAVGVDIGCGMIYARTNLTASDLPDNLLGVRTAIEKAVPHGRTQRGRRGYDVGGWGNVQADIADGWWVPQLKEGYDLLMAKHPRLKGANAVNHLGTLGTGNHFIELVVDEEQRVGVMLHSGSRGIGNAIGTHFIAKAQQRLDAMGLLPDDADLAWLDEGSPDFADYIEAVGWAQRFAWVNRQVMMARVVMAVRNTLCRPLVLDEAAVNCHHNYVQLEEHFGQEVWLTRKGAVSARAGELGIIPGSMGAKSFIVRGKGNPESYHSCSHGAGRRMSRTKARQQITLAMHRAATAGVECRKDESVLDESPGAYKDIDAVMAAQADLVEVVHTLKQVCCVKG